MKIGAEVRLKFFSYTNMADRDGPKPSAFNSENGASDYAMFPSSARAMIVFSISLVPS